MKERLRKGVLHLQVLQAMARGMEKRKERQVSQGLRNSKTRFAFQPSFMDFDADVIPSSSQQPENLAEPNPSDDSFYTEQQPGVDADMDALHMAAESIPAIQAQINQVTIMLNNPTLPMPVRQQTEMKHAQLQMELQQAQMAAALIQAGNAAAMSAMNMNTMNNMNNMNGMNMPVQGPGGMFGVPGVDGGMGVPGMMGPGPLQPQGQ